MALQILNQPSWQSLTGQALGQGLGGGIAGLLDKLGQEQVLKQQRGAATQYFQSRGMSPEVAQALALQPESIQREAVKQMQREREGMAFGDLLGQVLSGQPDQAAQPGVTPAAKVSTQMPVTPQTAKDIIGISQKERKMKEEKEARSRQEEFRERELKSSEYDRIVKQNKTFNTSMKENISVAQPLHDTVTEMLNLLKSGKLKSGPAWGQLPGALSEDDQRYDQLAKKIVLLKADATKGRATDYKTKMIEKEKVSRDQQVGAQEKNLKKMIKDAEKIITQDRIRQSIIQENKNLEPQGLEGLVKRKFHEYERAKSGDFVKELPDPFLEKGGRYEDTDTGEIYESDGIQWVPVKGAQNAI